MFHIRPSTRLIPKKPKIQNQVRLPCKQPPRNSPLSGNTMAPALKTKSRPPGGFPAARTNGPTGAVRGVGEFAAEWRRHEDMAAGRLQPTSYTPAWGGDQAGAQQNIPVQGRSRRRHHKEAPRWVLQGSRGSASGSATHASKQIHSPYPMPAPGDRRKNVTARRSVGDIWKGSKKERVPYGEMQLETW